MAKNKNRSQSVSDNKKKGMTAASSHAHMALAEDIPVLPEEEKVSETVKPDEEKEMLLAIVRRLMDDMGADSLSALTDMIDKAEERKLTEGYGLDAAAAQLFLMQQEKVRALREAERAAAREAVYAEMRNDPMFDDVDGRKNAVETYILRTGASPKEAYFALFAEETLRRMAKEMETAKTESDKKAKNIPALSGGDAPDVQRNIQLSEAEKRMAKRAGMTADEYAKYKYAY